MKLKDLGKKLHDSILEDDDAEKPAAPAAAIKQPSAWSPTPAPMTPGFGVAIAPGLQQPSVAVSPFSVPSSVVLDDAVYQRVLDKTNFDSTDVGRAMHKYYDALEGAGLDQNTRFKTALTQAAALDGISADKVIATFDSLKTALQQENDHFANIVSQQNKNEVVSRQIKLQQIADQITQKQQEIAQLNQQAAQLNGEVVDAQNKITSATTQMQLASVRRANEIDQQKAQFTVLLSH
jgi:hypothetical protein